MKANEVMKVRRLELGLTQKEVADRVGVTEATVSRWESGDIKNMRRDKIAALARALDVSPAVLMDWEQYDAEAAERRKLARELSEWSNVAEIEHLRIAFILVCARATKKSPKGPESQGARKTFACSDEFSLI